MDLEFVGNEIVQMIKTASFFPVGKAPGDPHPGLLRDHAFGGMSISSNEYWLFFDSTVAPYVEYLEEGTSPHNIFNAFGKTVNPDGTWNYWYPFGGNVAYPFGIGGRFNGKFHPGSTKHKDFIKDKTINAILSYFVVNYGGEVR